jgi:putative oxidoreductase
MKRDWFSSSVHDSERSFTIIRVMLAFILISHPIYALVHPANIRGFGYFLESRGIPFGAGLAWAVMFFQIGCSLALAARRFVAPACIGHIFVLVMGVFLVHAPRWRTVGLEDGDHKPGAEFSVLMIVLLFAIMWAQWRPAAELPLLGKKDSFSDRAFEFVCIASASILIIHPIGGLRDPAGLNDLGNYYSSIGVPFGVPLIWGVMFLQIASSLALIARRFVVPACLGHISVLVTGVCLYHAPYWFVIGPDSVVGPGREGMEYSILLITCFFSILLAYWPKQRSS